MRFLDKCVTVQKAPSTFNTHLHVSGFTILSTPWLVLVYGLLPRKISVCFPVRVTLHIATLQGYSPYKA